MPRGVIFLVTGARRLHNSPYSRNYPLPAAVCRLKLRNDARPRYLALLLALSGGRLCRGLTSCRRLGRRRSTLRAGERATRAAPLSLLTLRALLRYSVPLTTCRNRYRTAVRHCSAECSAEIGSPALIAVSSFGSVEVRVLAASPQLKPLSKPARCRPEPKQC